jgi:hypothetical protein
MTSAVTRIEKRPAAPGTIEVVLGSAAANAEQNIFRKTFDLRRPVFQRTQVFEPAHFVGRARAAFLTPDIEVHAPQC